MKVALTALILSQGRTFLVMMAAGILTETLWQGKGWMQRRSASRRADAITADGGRNLAAILSWVLVEAVFWISAAGILTAFLYYCAYGKLSVHAAAGYFIGLLLWKKILQCVILSP